MQTGQPDDLDERLAGGWQRYLTAADREHRAAQNRAETAFPHFSEDGRWRLRDVNETSTWNGDRYEHGNWTAGFWYGVMWLRALGAGDDAARELARQRLHHLAPRAVDTTTHDLGFLFSPSFVLGHDLGYLGELSEHSGETEATEIAHRAAVTLAGRMHGEGRYLQAFSAIGDARSAGSSTIDTMLNLPLLWWASTHGGDPILHVVARHHARTSARLYFRPDGSTCHLLTLDPLTGALLDRGTFQGAGANSCWSRGQAWAVCGFAWAYAATGERELLEAADRAADYFFVRVPSDGVPAWDFSDADPAAPRDASAATVTALGALILGDLHPESERRGWYSEQGRELLAKATETSLNDGQQTADAGGTEGILLDSCYSQPDGLGLAGATGWGDFFTGLALALGAGAVELPTALGFEPVV